MGIRIFNFLKQIQSKWQLLKNKLSKASLTKSGKPMMSINPELSIRKRPRSSFKTLLETSDPETNSLMRPSMKFSLLSTRTNQEPLRRTKWSPSSSNTSAEHDDRAEPTHNREPVGARESLP